MSAKNKAIERKKGRVLSYSHLDTVHTTKGHKRLHELKVGDVNRGAGRVSKIERKVSLEDAREGNKKGSYFVHYK